MNWPHCLLSVGQTGPGKINLGVQFSHWNLVIQDTSIKMRYKEIMVKVRRREKRKERKWGKIEREAKQVVMIFKTGKSMSEKESGYIIDS